MFDFIFFISFNNINDNKEKMFIKTVTGALFEFPLFAVNASGVKYCVLNGIGFLNTMLMPQRDIFDSSKMVEMGNGIQIDDTYVFDASESSASSAIKISDWGWKIYTHFLTTGEINVFGADIANLDIGYSIVNKIKEGAEFLQMDRPRDPDDEEICVYWYQDDLDRNNKEVVDILTDKEGKKMNSFLNLFDKYVAQNVLNKIGDRLTKDNVHELRAEMERYFGKKPYDPNDPENPKNAYSPEKIAVIMKEDNWFWDNL